MLKTLFNNIKCYLIHSWKWIPTPIEESLGKQLELHEAYLRGDINYEQLYCKRDLNTLVRYCVKCNQVKD